MKKQVLKYIIGFIVSLALTLTAYYAAVNHVSDNNMLIGIIIALALVQLIVQLIFFLHLGEDRWNMIILLSTVSIILILVLGSIWIMGHLNYNMIPGEMNSYIMHNEAIER